MHTIDIALDTIDNDALTPRSAQARQLLTRLAGVRMTRHNDSRALPTSLDDVAHESSRMAATVSESSTDPWKMRSVVSSLLQVYM
jgi:hypothetical protein